MEIYDKDGNQITIPEWNKLHSDMDYRVVGRHRLGRKKNGKSRRLVSTVWLGRDHSFDDEDIAIFETVIFWEPKGKKIFDEIYCRGYSTLQEAEQGHKNAVLAARSRKPNNYGGWERVYGRVQREKAQEMRDWTKRSKRR